MTDSNKSQQSRSRTREWRKPIAPQEGPLTREQEIRNWLVRDLLLVGAPQDAAELHDIAEALTAEHGYSVVIDHEFAAMFPEVENRGARIRLAKVTIVVWTERSVGLPLVEEAAAIALDDERLVAVRLDHCRPPALPGGPKVLNLRRWGLRPDHHGWLVLKEHVRRRAVPSGEPTHRGSKTRAQSFAWLRSANPYLLTLTAVSVVAKLQDIVGAGNVIAKMCRDWMEVGDRLWALVFSRLPPELHLNPSGSVRHMLTTWTIVAATFGLIPLVVRRSSPRLPPLTGAFADHPAKRTLLQMLVQQGLFWSGSLVLMIPILLTALPLFVNPADIRPGQPAVANNWVWLFFGAMAVASAVTVLINAHRLGRIEHLRDLDRFDLSGRFITAPVEDVEAAEQLQDRVIAGFVIAAIVLLWPALIDPAVIIPGFRIFVGAAPLLLSFTLLQSAMASRSMLPAAALAMIVAGILTLDFALGLVIDLYVALSRDL